MSPSIQESIDLARSHRVANRLPEAEAVCRSIIEIDPTVPEAYFLLGGALGGQQRFLEGAEAFRTSLPLIRNAAKYHRILTNTVGLYVADRKARAQGLKVRGGPITAEIEVTAHCQLNCPFCRTGLDLRKTYPEISRGVLKMATLEEILRQTPDLFYARLYNWGEPFLHPNLPAVVARVKQAGVHCEISTNMQIMTDEIAEALVKADLDIIRISCDGMTQETYERYRKGGSLSKVLENSRLLADAKRRLGSIRPAMVFQMIVHRHNEHEVDQFAQFASAAGADLIDQIGICVLTDEGSKDFDEWVPTDARFPALSQDKSLTGCRQPWYHTSFDWNGDIYTCCNPSGLQKYKMGNIHDSAFESTWSSARYQSTRDLILDPEAEPEALPLACREICHAREFGGRWFPERLTEN